MIILKIAFKSSLFFCLLFTFLQTNTSFAQRFQEPADIKTNPSIYPDNTERQKVLKWSKNADNAHVKIFSKSDFMDFDADKKAMIEAHGYIIIYQGNYLRWSEIQAYEGLKGQIVQRSYDEYKAYLVQNNIQHYHELFGY